jgi:hypothetical protein
MSLDFSIPGEARLTMAGYVKEILTTSGVTGKAATPATEGLFDVRGKASAVSEEVRVWFREVVAQLLYLAKRIRPECVTAVAYLATRVTKCNGDDVEKLFRRGPTETKRVILQPGVLGICVRLYVDVSYGVHSAASHIRGAA